MLRSLEDPATAAGTRPTRRRPTRCVSPWRWCTRRHWRRRVTGALAALDRLRARLRDELGVDPSAESTRLRQALLGNRCPEPMAVTRTPEFRPSGRSTAWPSSAGTRSSPGCARRSTPRRGGAARGSPVRASRGSWRRQRDVALPVLTCRAFLPEREAWGLARSVLQEALALDAAPGRPARARSAPRWPSSCPRSTASTSRSTARPASLAGGSSARRRRPRRRRLVVDDLQWADPSSLTFLASALGPTAPPCGRPRLPARRAGPRRACRLRVREASCRWTRPLFSRPSARDRRRRRRVGSASRRRARRARRRSRLALRAETDRTPFAVGEVVRELAVRGVAVTGPDGRWLPRDAAAVALAGRSAGRGSGGPCGAVRAGDRRARSGPGARRAARPGDHRPDRGDGGGPRPACGPRRPVRAGHGRPAPAREQGWATAHDPRRGDRDRRAGTGRARSPAGCWRGAGGRRRRSRRCPAPPRCGRRHRCGRRVRAGRPSRTRGHATREAAAHAEAGLAVETRPACSTPGPRHGPRTATSPELSPTCRRLDRRRGPARSRRLSRSAMLTMAPRSGACRRAAELALVEAGDDDAARAVALETAAILDVNLGRAGRAAAGRRRARALPRPRRRAGVAGSGRPRDGGLPRRPDHRGGRLFGRIATLFETRATPARRHASLDPRARPGLPRRARGGAGGDARGGAARRDLGAPEGQARCGTGRRRCRPSAARRGRADAREALTVAGRSGTAGGPRPPGARLASRCRSSSGSTRPPRRSGVRAGCGRR